MSTITERSAVNVEIGSNRLAGILRAPAKAKGLVIFAHGSGSGRLSPRNNYVAEALQQQGLASLLLDLLTPSEELDRANVFDIGLLAGRLRDAASWAAAQPAIAELPVGYFGASTGAAAALVAAAHPQSRVRAVVSRGGRPDLAGRHLTNVRAPTLLIVGSRDHPVIELNREALSMLRSEKQMIIVSGAGHLFEEPGTLDMVVRYAGHWFSAHLPEGVDS